MLTHEYFCKLDFYRKYNYLSILLTSYVIQYIVFRRDANIGILCKGAPSDRRLNGAIHRACCNNYAEIRNLFPNLLQKYYEELVRQEIGEEKEIHCYADGEKVYISNLEFEEFSTVVLGSRNRKQNLNYDTVVRALGLKEWEDSVISIEDFVVRYISLKKPEEDRLLLKYPQFFLLADDRSI